MSEPDSPDSSLAASRATRLAKNEVFFREVNEIAAKDGSRPSTSHVFFCECSSGGCIERIDLTGSEYEYVRANGDRFFVVPGHEDNSVERVVETHDRYLIVEKTGLAGIIAERADPRGN